MERKTDATEKRTCFFINAVFILCLATVLDGTEQVAILETAQFLVCFFSGVGGKRAFQSEFTSKSHSKPRDQNKTVFSLRKQRKSPDRSILRGNGSAADFRNLNAVVPNKKSLEVYSIKQELFRKIHVNLSIGMSSLMKNIQHGKPGNETSFLPGKHSIIVNSAQ